MDYILHLLVFAQLYGMLALSLNVGSGATQLISLAQAGFFGVGAYTTAILATRYGWPMWMNIPLGMIVAALIALPVGLVALRTIADYFVICTMGMGFVLFAAMNNWMDLTRGPLGIAGIPAATLCGHPLTARWQWVLLAGTFYALVFCLSRNIQRSAFGRTLVAIGEDEVFCQSLGKNVGLAKIASFVLGAMLAAIPGVLYAHYVSFIDPTMFTIQESIFILSVVVVGGLGNAWGSTGAAAFMILIPEALRFFGVTGGATPNVRQLIYGGLLIVIVLRRHSATDPVNC